MVTAARLSPTGIKLGPAMRKAIDHARLLEDSNNLIAERCGIVTARLIHGRGLAEAQVQVQAQARLAQQAIREMVTAGFHPAEAIGALGLA